MKRLLILLLTVCFFIFPASCSDETKTNQSIADEVIINLPKDDSVNGYRTDSSKNNNNSMPDKIDAKDVAVGDINSKTESNTKAYCGNKNSKVFHKSDCDSVSSMKENNKYFADRSSLISEGYKPCGKCKP